MLPFRLPWTRGKKKLNHAQGWGSGGQDTVGSAFVTALEARLTAGLQTRTASGGPEKAQRCSASAQLLGMRRSAANAGPSGRPLSYCAHRLAGIPSHAMHPAPSRCAPGGFGHGQAGHVGTGKKPPLASSCSLPARTRPSLSPFPAPAVRRRTASATNARPTSPLLAPHHPSLICMASPMASPNLTPRRHVYSPGPRFASGMSPMIHRDNKVSRS
jgi:hypothetical protein